MAGHIAAAIAAVNMLFLCAQPATVIPFTLVPAAVCIVIALVVSGAPIAFFLGALAVSFIGCGGTVVLERLHLATRKRGCTDLEQAILKYHDIEETEAEARKSLRDARLGMDMAAPNSGISSSYTSSYEQAVKKLSEVLERKERQAERIEELGGRRPERDRLLEEAPDAFLN